MLPLRLSERCCWPEVSLTTPSRPQAESAYTAARADGSCGELARTNGVLCVLAGIKCVFVVI